MVLCVPYIGIMRSIYWNAQYQSTKSYWNFRVWIGKI